VGPTTAALLRFYQADQAFREASRKLDAATRDVRTQEARVAQLKTEHDDSHRKAVAAEARSKEIDLELKAREDRIELLRDRQTNATDDKAYKALIVEINTHKADKGKLEEQGVAQLETLEGLKKTVADLKARGENEGAKLATMKSQVDDKVAALTAEVAALRGPRDAAAAEVTPAAMSAFKRAGERYDGEGMASIERPDPREVEYLCNGCNTYLVANVYNRLMSSKDEIVLCPSCGRILYVPTELTPEIALAKKGGTTTKPAKAAKAPKEPKVPGEKKPRAPRAKKEKAPAGPAPEPGSVAAAIAAGAGAAGGRGVKAVAPSAPSAPPSIRADGSVIKAGDEDAVEPDTIDQPAAAEQPASN
jgi:predicted  nucleic acid-binding Zn-ribbon protein